MDSSQRIRLARRQAGFSQRELAARIGVQRSAVSHWESPTGKNPSLAHLQMLAVTVNVQFEWLATGRGEMRLPAEQALDSIAAAMGTLVDDDFELRLLRCFRRASARGRVLILEMAEVVAPEARRHRPRTALLAVADRSVGAR